jgi:hypothetical protein
MKGIQSYEYGGLPMSVQAREFQEIDDDEAVAHALLKACNGDPIAAIVSVVRDAEFLTDQLEIARTLLSHGMGRGWKPEFDRSA